MLDIKNNIVTPIIENLPEHEEIMAVKVNKNGTFTYKKHVYESEHYDHNESHIEERTIPIPNIRQGKSL